jgi:hypothetical protein
MKRSNLETLNLTELKKVLDIYYTNRATLYLWGKPSTGKTSIIRQFAKKKAEAMGLKYSEDVFAEDTFTLKIFTLSQCDSPDLRGMPKISNIQGVDTTSFIPTEDLPRVGHGILFFDELNNADETTQRAAYQLILEGAYGNLPCLKEPDGTDAFWRVAASNSEDDMCGAAQLPLALLRRFSHYEVMPDTSEIIDYFLESDIDSRIISYLGANNSDLFPIAWEEKLLDKKANPFPFQWERIGKMIKGLSIKDIRTIEQIASGCVGPELSGKLKAHIVVSNTIDWNNLLSKDADIVAKEIEKINNNSQKVSLVWSIMSEFSSRWKASRSNKKIVTLQQAINIINNLDIEFKIGLAKMLFNNSSISQTGALRVEPVIKELLSDIVDLAYTE